MLFVVTKKRVFLAVLLSSIIASTYFWAANYKLEGYVYNSTASMPYGWYKIVPMNDLSVGDIVVICPTNPFIKEAIARNYVPTKKPNESLNCSFVPLLKRIVAAKNDCVEIDKGVYINGKLEPNSLQKSIDSKGNAMPQIKLFTCLLDGQYIALTQMETGFDSRYLGIFLRNEIIAKVQPSLTWTW